MDAAKHIAKSFCWSIRYALTPVFGHNFPEMCLKPSDESFGNMTIDPAITERCRRQADYFREQELQLKIREVAKFAHLDSLARRSATPSSPVACKTKRGRKYKEEQICPSPYTSPYMTSAKSDDGYSSSGSPVPAYRSAFTPVNTPRQPPRSVPYPERKLPSPAEILAQSTPSFYTLQPPLTPAPTVGRYSSPEISPKTIPRKIIFKDPAHDRLPARVRLDRNWLDANLDDQEQRAVYALLSLKYHDTGKDLAQALGKSLHGDGSKRWTLPEGHFGRT